MIQVYGVFSGWWSHAQVSRGMAFGLARNGLDVQIYGTNFFSGYEGLSASIAEGGFDTSLPNGWNKDAPIGFYVGGYPPLIGPWLDTHQVKVALLNAEGTPVPRTWAGRAAELDLLCVPSKWAARAYVYGGVPREKILVVPHGVHPTYVHAKGAKHDPDGPYFHVAGAQELYDRKGTPALIAACAALRRRLVVRAPFGPLIRLIADIPRAQQYVEMECSQDALPPHKMLQRYGAGWRAIVQPSRAEAFGLVPLEARVLGLPVIATRCTCHYDRLVKRRNSVLELMFNQGSISEYQARTAKSKKLTTIKHNRIKTDENPAFMDLLRRQLLQDYEKEDLSSEGLQIFSTFDPYVQKITEDVVKDNISQLDTQKHLNGKLQTAVIVTNTNNADVIAMVGDKDPTYAGFNRALDAKRPIGSLIKPAIYMTALLQSDKYSLVTPVEDSSISLKAEDGKIWSPSNYSEESHGVVPLYIALINSYNQATVRLGLELGFEAIVTTLRNLGIQRDIPPYPSMLLGAVAMSPLEITQMYQTLSSEGFITPLHTIRAVLTSKGEPLKSYPIQIKQGIDETTVRIINSALHEVTRLGTAQSLSWRLGKDLKVAGKTGTTNDTRDSWFAGFSGEHLIVTWLGTDDNQSTGLTGATGALPIWSSIMKKIRTRPLAYAFDDKLDYFYVEPKTGRLTDEKCVSASYLAFHKDNSPGEYGSCPE